MSNPDARYALYYAPEDDSALGAFGQEWLNPTERQPPDWVQDGELWSEATASAAHYGFHATLKAPFRLATGQSEAALLDATQRLADELASFETPALKLSELGRYLAFTFDGPCPGMDVLHRRCVVDLDRFRAPLTDADRQRRIASGITAQQRELLEQYGYPYVMQAFDFHLTLAGPLDEKPRAQIKQLLADQVSQHSYPRLKIESICIFFQKDSKSAFRLLRRFTFS